FRKKKAFTVLKMVVLAEIPSASVITATAVKPAPSAACADQSANRVRSLESRSRGARRGISLSSARYRPGRVARDGAPLLAPSLGRRIPLFFVPGGRAARRPIPGPPAPGETTTARAVESCKANARVAFSDLLYSYLRATIGSTRVAR